MAVQKNDEVQLKVVEALQDDVYKGVARIDPGLMKKLGLSRGDVVAIQGENQSVAIVDRAYPADVGEEIIRIDGLIRRNARTSVGETVLVKKATVRPAKSISIAPAEAGVMIQGDPDMFKSALLGRAFVRGDLFSLGGSQRRGAMVGNNLSDIFGDLNDLFGGADPFGGQVGGGFSGFKQIKFVVTSGSPSGAVFVNEDTEVQIHHKAVDVSDDGVPDVTYEDIGGLTEEVKKIREMVELPLRHPEVFERLGVEPPKGVLLHGPPGTGKTLLAKAVANESEANFILLNGPEIMSKFYGESEKKIRDIFEDAEKNAPTIVFIDEIDAIAPKREEVQGEVERRVVSQLLTMMDGLQGRGRVIVVGATNRINSVDPALRRPGRFDREVSISVPDKGGRLNILKIHTRGMPLVGEFNLSVASRDLSKKLDTYLDNFKMRRDELDSELSELQSFKAKRDDSLIGKVINELGGLSGRIKKLEGIRKAMSYKETLKDVTSVLASIERSDCVWDDLDVRRHFSERKAEGIENEVLSIVDDLIKVGVIDKAFYSDVRRKGVSKMLDSLSGRTHGFVGADLNALTKEAAMNVLRKLLPELKLEEDEPIPPEVLDKIVIKPEDFDSALKVVRPSAMREVLVEAPNVNWEDVGGLTGTKGELKEAVEWPIKFADRFKRLGIRAPRGILLYGPPGTGKTLLAKAVAKESEANFIQVKGPSLLSQWVGKSEEGVRKVFERARQVAPCVVFFDEMDALAGRRGVEQGTKVTERVLNQMLAEIDGLEGLKDVTIIGATNRPDMLDPALLRPGRFDRIILVDVPDEVGREEILKVHTRDTPLAKDVSLSWLVKQTAGFVGADLEGLVREAAMFALRQNPDSEQVARKDFEEALKKMRPSVSEDTAKRYKKIEDYYLKQAKAGMEVGPMYTG